MWVHGSGGSSCRAAPVHRSEVGSLVQSQPGHVGLNKEPIIKDFVFFHSLPEMEVLQFLRDEEAQPPTAAAAAAAEVPESLVEREDKCRKKMATDPPYSQSGWRRGGAGLNSMESSIKVVFSRRCRSALQAPLGRPALLGRHPRRKLRLPEVSKRRQRLQARR